MDIEFDPTFDPVRCAELHNQLLAKAVSHLPNAPQQFRRDVLTRWQNCPAEARPSNFNISEGSPLYTFLTLIDSFNPDEIPLTAEFTQPEPLWFDNEIHGYEAGIRGSSFILLYGDESEQLQMEGGLYFDLETNLLALEKALKLWECGKFCLGSPAYSFPARADTVVCYKKWLARDLESALFRWEHILNAIQDRVPLPKGTHRPPLLDPLPTTLVEQFELSTFAKAFLCAPKRPSFKFVAPGITVFTPELFAAIYGAESPNSRRRQNNDEEGWEPLSLILPSTTGPIQGTSGNGVYDGEIYLPKADPTYYQYTGIFTTDQCPETDGDAIIQITPEGAEDPIRHDGHRPWGPDCPIRLEEMFDNWFGNIDNGNWEVGPDGVTTPTSWYLDPETVDMRRILWTEESR